MILVENQRGGAKDLAMHLLKDENDHVEVYELRGFAASDLRGAFNEAYAISRGSRCRQHLYSCSFNPPATANVRMEDFEAAISRVETELGLKGQPRAIVFHEKAGRRHAHCVWSRIRADDMKAVQLSFTHKKLMAIARELYIEHGWKMPRGLAKSKASDPRNFTLAEWQQAKRIGQDPRTITTALQDAWAVSDTKATLILALEERGYKLAQGDSKTFVVVDRHGEIYSLPRQIGLRTKEVRARLGNGEDLPDVGSVRAGIAKDMRPILSGFKSGLLADLRHENKGLREERQKMLSCHRETRKALSNAIEERHWKEARERQARFRTGLKGMWDWARGETKRIRKRNEAEAKDSMQRDRAELDALIFRQLEERRRMLDIRSQIAREFSEKSRCIRDDIRAYDNLARHSRTSVLETKRGRKRR